jgi:sulfofructose kinase
MNTDVIGVGIAALDHWMVVPEFPCGEGMIVSSQYRVEGGGMIATALITAQRLGLSTEFWGRVGEDENGHTLLKELKSYGLNTTQIHVVPQGRTGVCFAMVKAGSGERAFVAHSQKNLFVDLQDLNLDRIRKAKVLLIDATWAEAAQQSAHFARSHGIPVVADVHEPSQPSLELLSITDYAIIPRHLADVLAPKGDYTSALKHLRSRNVKVPIVTLGQEGCIYLYQDKIFKQPAFQVQAVDTNGTSDCFHGAFCFAIVRGLPVPEAVAFASAVTALASTKPLGRSGIPTYEQSIKFMREQGAKA